MAYSFKKKSAKLTKEGWIKVLQFGLIAGLLMSIVSLLYHEMGVFPYKLHTWIDDTLLFGVMIWAAVKIRIAQNNFLSMRQAYLACVGVGVIAAIIFCGYLLIYILILHPQFIAGYVDYTMAEITNNADLSESNRMEQLKTLEYATPVAVAFSRMFEIIMLSVFIPLFLSLFLRNEKKA